MSTSKEEKNFTGEATIKEAAQYWQSFDETFGGDALGLDEDKFQKGSAGGAGHDDNDDKEYWRQFDEDAMKAGAEEEEETHAGYTWDPDEHAAKRARRGVAVIKPVTPKAKPKAVVASASASNKNFQPSGAPPAKAPAPKAAAPKVGTPKATLPKATLGGAPASASKPPHPKSAEIQAEDLPNTTEGWIKAQERLFGGLPPLPPGWIRMKSRSKKCIYFYNTKNGQSCSKEPKA